VSKSISAFRRKENYGNLSRKSRTTPTLLLIGPDHLSQVFMAFSSELGEMSPRPQLAHPIQKRGKKKWTDVSH